MTAKKDSNSRSKSVIEKQFQSLVKAAPDAILGIDHEGEITIWNAAATRMFGLSAKRPIGTHLHELIIPDRMLAKARKGMKNFANTGKGPLIGNITECIARHKDGSEFPVELSISSFKEQGHWQAVGIIRDISKRKQVKKVLLDEQEQCHMIIETARDAFVSMNAKGEITNWNPRAEDIFGWNRKEVLGHLMSKTIIPKAFRNAHEKGLKHYLTTGRGPVLNQHIEITALHRDGHTIPVELSIVPIHTGDEISFNAFIRDISGKVQAKKEQEKSRDLLRSSLIGTIVAVSRAVGARDPYTAGHQQRVSQLARSIAQEIGLEKEQTDGLRMGASIHDIGKIYLPAEILSKPTKLTDVEYALIKSHSQVGYDILKDIAFPWPVAEIAHQHHERMDGSGYPQGLKGDEICLEARIVGVADVVEAMASHRPYRPALGIDVALEEIQSKRGQWFDPIAVDACLKLFKEKKFSFKSS